MSVGDLVYLLTSTCSDSRMTCGLVPGRKTCITCWKVLGVCLIVLTLLSLPCQGQPQVQGRVHRHGSSRTRFVPREEGGGLAFIMDNWLFQRSDPSTPATAEQENLVDEQPSHPQSQQDDEVTHTYLETSWNEPASFIHREYQKSEDQTEETDPNSTEAGEESSDTNLQGTQPSSTEVKLNPAGTDSKPTDPNVTDTKPSAKVKEASTEVIEVKVAATDPTSSDEDNLPTSPVQTRATEASPTTPRQVRNSPRRGGGRARGRNRNSSGNRQGDENGSSEKEATKRTTRSKEDAPTTEESKTAEVEETKKKEPQEGDLKLEGGDIEGTGNVIIYRHGEWGAVCDDGWNIHSANVVCKQLGHPHALGQTSQAYFGKPEQGIKLDNVQCFGDEKFLTECSSAPWREHDCDIREAAGVFCAPRDLIVKTSPAPTTTTPAPTPRPTRLTPRQRRLRRLKKTENGTAPASALRKTGLQALHALQADENAVNRVPAYKMRVSGGRNPKEGRLEVRVGGRWGVICAKPWTLREATVACRHLGLGYAQMPVVGTAFGGSRMDKVLNGIKCEGHEQHLYECYHEQVNQEVECDEASLVAGVICTNLLPDLVPNATMLEVSTYLDDVPMYYLSCAMEENCAAPSAYRIKQRYHDWRQQRRRLMRFSSSTWNFGTADFRPFINKELWEWHQCHMHYHSMETFANYDILDSHGNKVADGHKASFCLEDVECMPGAEKRYECVGYSDQGISVGCADTYLYNIDCQWIDITDMPNGKYIFRIHVNPERMVPELSFDNNAATCDLEYNGYEVYVTGCVVGNGDISNHG